MPVYNTARYLPRTLESIFNQSIGVDMFKLIAIDDGSIDNSLSILRKYLQKFPDNMEVISKSNEGIGPTRNLGIERTTSKYIAFIDSDDYYDIDFLKKHVTKAEETGADIVSSGYTRITPEGQILRQFIPEKITDYTKYITLSSCNRIHRVSFLTEKKIKFFLDTYVEDAPFSVLEIAQGAKFAFINYSGYYWVAHNDSFSGTKMRLQDKDNQKLALEQLALYIKMGESLKRTPEFSYFMLKALIHQFKQGRNQTSQKFMKHYGKGIRLLKEAVPNSLKLSVISGGRGDELELRVVVFLFLVIYKLNLMPLLSKIYCTGRENGKN
ncbi:glycosyltransferase family 2 protein [Lactococcus allomyrinae]|nr:glycosyltransferase family 2 protein [Lactococcus allomyrinae]